MTKSNCREAGVTVTSLPESGALLYEDNGTQFLEQRVRRDNPFRLPDPLQVCDGLAATTILTVDNHYAILRPGAALWSARQGHQRDTSKQRVHWPSGRVDVSTSGNATPYVICALPAARFPSHANYLN